MPTDTNNPWPDEDERRRQGDRVRASRSTANQPGAPAAAAARPLPANSGAPVVLDPASRGEVLFRNPIAAMDMALRERGINPYTSYVGGILRRKYQPALQSLFELNSLNAGQNQGLTTQGAIDQGMGTFADFARALISGAAGGQGLNQILGYDPNQALQNIFDRTGTGGTDKPRGLAWDRFYDPQTGMTDQRAMREWLMGLQQQLLAIGGANPWWQRAMQGRQAASLNQFDVDLATNQNADPNGLGWLDIILGR